ncbi:MAG: efflux transporter outer membrane subunit [Pseudomonadota bacterium]
MNRFNVSALSISIALIAGCASMAPNYQRPEAPVSAIFPTYGTGAQAPSASQAEEIPWRAYFADPRLREVIALALENNRDLRQAALRVEQARAQYRIQRADLFPMVGIDGSQSAKRLPADLSGTGASVTQRQYDVTVGFSAWEPDIFGRIRSLGDQAMEQYFATEEAARGVRISLIAEVAQAWLTLAADRERLALAWRTYESRNQSLDLIRRGHELGALSALDLRQSETLLEGARADKARYQAVVNRDENALVLLVGAPLRPEWLPDALGESVGAVAELPAGVPSEVLARRPDILQAEHSLRAMNANIGAARAAFFPRISLTAQTGTASGTLDGLFGNGSGTWGFMPQVHMPIFEAGRLQADLAVAETQRDMGIALYEKAIQTAFREVADALADKAALGEQLGALRALKGATAESLRLAEARYRAGADSHLVLLDAQRSLYGAEQQLIDARLAADVNRVVMYKVLGGGVL